VAPPAAARPLPPAPVILPPAPPLLRGPFATPQRRSLADMANEQLRRGKPKDPLAEGMEGAGRDDCLHAPQKEGTLGGLLALPSVAAKALSGNCPK
jgi:hypothetical protein